MGKRVAGLLTGVFAAMALAACAEGSTALPAGFDAGNTPQGPVCGNGVLEEGEMCECEPGQQTCPVVDSTQSCQSLVNGSGLLLCNAANCGFDTSMCTTMGNGGSGGGGEGG